MRKKREIIKTASLLAGELSVVGEGSVARMRDGSTVDVSRYAHGAAVALGLLALYAKGCKSPTVEEILKMSVAWTEEHADAHEGRDEREGEADHE